MKTSLRAHLRAAAPALVGLLGAVACASPRGSAALAPPLPSEAANGPRTAEERVRASDDEPRANDDEDRANDDEDRASDDEDRANDDAYENEPWDHPRLEIATFDCTSSLDHKSGQSLRDPRGGGGPFGSMWNWYGGALICSVTIDSNCRADAQVTVRVGQRYESGRMVSIDPSNDETAAPTTTRFEIAAAAWEHELIPGPTRQYENLLFLAWVEARCLGPVGSSPEPISLTDSFVARFSGGE